MTKVYREEKVYKIDTCWECPFVRSADRNRVIQTSLKCIKTGYVYDNDIMHNMVVPTCPLPDYIDNPLEFKNYTFTEIAEWLEEKYINGEDAVIKFKNGSSITIGREAIPEMRAFIIKGVLG